MERREFLKGAAILGGAAAFAGITGCSGDNAAATDNGITWDGEADVVIVGAGGGGLAAAIVASKANQNVLVLEVMGTAGESNSAICGGMIQGAVTSVQKAAGIQDSAEEYDKYLAAVAEGYADEKLRKLFAENSGATIDWLIEQGVEFPEEQLSSFGTEVDFYTDVTPAVARMHWVKGMIGSSITKPLYDVATKQGVRFQFNTQVTKLITSSAGEVIGVTAKVDKAEKNYKAKKGIILNTAGFTRNKEMLKTFLTPPMPGMENAAFGTYGSLWQQGDGIRMGQAIGAKLTNMWVAYNLAPGIMKDDVTGGFLMAGPNLPGIWVSTDGKRHVREDTSRPTEVKVSEIWSQPGGFVWAIWDQAVTDNGQMPVATLFSQDLKDEIAKGQVFSSPTIAELAKAIGVDAATLEQTVATYNANAEAGNDPELGRVATLAPLKTGPFYAAKVGAVSPDTAGGLAVNTNLQVVNVSDEVIPRLYAVGNTTGGWKGKINAGCGQALGWTYTGGRIAGEHVATLKAWS